MKGQKGSMRNGNQKFNGCENCPALTCFSCHHSEGLRTLGKLPHPSETKPRWTPER